MTYLVDANILSEPTKSAPNARVVTWLTTHEAELRVDPVILGELRFGILLLPKGRKRNHLEDWFAQGVKRIECVPLDAATGLRWADIVARLRREGTSMPLKDSLIAATALVHDFTVVTRNRADFQKAGVRVLDPFVDR